MADQRGPYRRAWRERLHIRRACVGHGRHDDPDEPCPGWRGWPGLPAWIGDMLRRRSIGAMHNEVRAHLAEPVRLP